ncbi:endoribonuclease L-PSP [Thecamonas trahens ATCC 50062]|uniref:Endoribonuclease L-PSP n=1 Tax=Thecamonas trahens ATCC 50062 TaxID=461836 RepID=A0A0L0DT37_THETB|nr:endoribonuclease L-PSP [Thecamonas trahens ATCC 50062]KNC54593.1 endoribonuclease L-PSP [Thecamonas trahens ATCC 50062]|eukprot:XP_013761502.1 endoribonuclease L-PSP [Thecamonas trahens ATCC 50062]
MFRAAGAVAGVCRVASTGVRSKTTIVAEGAPAAIGPYSHAVTSGKMVYTSGSLGVSAEGELADGVQAQTQLALENLGAVLKAAGANHGSVVKTLVLLETMDDFPAVNEVYAQFFPENPPARSCFAVKALPLGAKVEIEAVAEIVE